MDWDAFFKAMIAEEHAADKKYAAAAQQTDDPTLKKLLEQFQYEEDVHADLLETQYARRRKQQAAVGRRNHIHRRERPLTAMAHSAS